MIKLRVSGRIFETTLGIVKNIPYIYNMIVDTEHLEDEIIINRSPKVFEHVLAYAIDSKHPVPEKYLYELDFYGIDYVKKYPDSKSILEETERIRSFLITIREHQQIIPKNSWICFGANCDGYGLDHSFFCGKCKHQCYSKNCDRVSETNYCDDHYKAGYYCNQTGCTNIRVDNNVLCYKHYE